MRARGGGRKRTRETTHPFGEVDEGVSAREALSGEGDLAVLNVAEPLHIAVSQGGE